MLLLYIYPHILANAYPPNVFSCYDRFPAFPRKILGFAEAQLLFFRGQVGLSKASLESHFETLLSPYRLFHTALTRPIRWFTDALRGCKKHLPNLSCEKRLLFRQKYDIIYMYRYLRGCFRIRRGRRRYDKRAVDPSYDKSGKIKLNDNNNLALAA